MAFRIFLIVTFAASAFMLYDIVRSNVDKVRMSYAPQGYYLGAAPAQASHTLIEFLDYSCVRCKATHPVLMRFLERRSDIRYIPHPVMSDNESGILAAKFAYAAGLQNKFLEAHHMLMTLDHPVDDDMITKLSSTLNLDVQQVKADMQRSHIEQTLKTHLEWNKDVGSPTVPTFVIDGKITWIVANAIPTVQEFEHIFNQAEAM